MLLETDQLLLLALFHYVLTAALAHTLIQGEDQDWWQVDLDISKEAGVVNFVTNFGNMWDNNGAKDYAIRVSSELCLYATCSCLILGQV
jgi:hypothetical protein